MGGKKRASNRRESFKIRSVFIIIYVLFYLKVHVKIAYTNN